MKPYDGIKAILKPVRDYVLRGGVNRWLHPKSVRLAYYAEVPNFGDSLNLDLMRHFAVDVCRAGTYHANLVAIGSMLDSFLLTRYNSRTTQEPVHVYGTGFLQPQKDDIEVFVRPMAFHALRGKLSRARCERITGRDLSGVPLGDPGLLASRMFANMQTHKLYDVAVVCHFADRGRTPLGNIRLGGLSVRHLDVRMEPERFVAELTSCRFVLSSAMHALICADSFGIPNKRIVLSDALVGGDYKFSDYYSVFEDVEAHAVPFDLRKNILSVADLDAFRREYSIGRAEVEDLVSSLESAFPFDLRDKRRLG